MHQLNSAVDAMGLQQLAIVKVKRCIGVSSRVEEVIVAIAIAWGVLKGPWSIYTY